MHLSYRIPAAARSSANGPRPLAARANPEDSGGPSVSVIVIAASVGTIVLILIGLILLKLRNNRPSSAFSKRAGYQQTNSHDDSSTNARGRSAPANFDAAVAEANRNSRTAAGVDRNISIRSVITLPAYQMKANENEQVLGREGERDGVDVVVDLRTADQDEALREEEMEALYQIRRARRQELEDREERRRLRREARARGDTVALHELNHRARAASQASVLSDLREEHQRVKNKRNRAVSSVSYADLGVARHDGSRVRANSQESERMGLLSDAASIDMSSTRSASALSHRRDRSASVLSFDSNQDFPSPGFPRSGTTTPRRLSAQHSGGSLGAGSSPEIINEADLGEEGMPPPGYDDVSLDDTRSGATTPLFNEPPPTYTAPTEQRDRGMDAHVADMMDNMNDEADLGGRHSSETSTRSSFRSSRQFNSGIPQLPSLRISTLPKIVIEPSSAHPRD